MADRAGPPVKRVLGSFDFDAGRPPHAYIHETPPECYRVGAILYEVANGRRIG
jgi:hypothetical protein